MKGHWVPENGTAKFVRYYGIPVYSIQINPLFTAGLDALKNSSNEIQFILCISEKCIISMTKIQNLMKSLWIDDRIQSNFRILQTSRNSQKKSVITVVTYIKNRDIQQIEVSKRRFGVSTLIERKVRYLERFLYKSLIASLNSKDFLTTFFLTFG